MSNIRKPAAKKKINSQRAKAPVKTEKSAKGKRIKNKIAPYTVAVACVGVVAFSSAIFSLVGNAHGAIENKENIHSSQSEVSEDASKEQETVVHTALTGKELDEELKNRTGISEMDNMKIPKSKIQPEDADSSEANESNTEDKKDESKAEDKKSEDKKDESKAEDKKSEDKKDESKAEDKKSKDKKDESKTEDKKSEDKKNESKSDEKKPDDKKDESKTEEKESSSSSENEAKPENGETKDETAAEEGKFNPATVGATGAGNIPSWKKKNSDVMGWLKIPNTNINYPVVMNEDNLYYNSKGYYKEPSKNGVIWGDCWNKTGNSSQISRNNIIYGHNWTNVSSNPQIGRAQDVMFGQLTAFHHLNFAQKTPYIHYSTEDEAMTWKVFAAFYTETPLDYLIQNDSTDAYMRNMIREAKARSMHEYDVDVNENDKILTLITCTRAYGKTPNQRFVVMARLMRSGEKIEEVEIKAHNNFKRPNVRF